MPTPEIQLGVQLQAPLWMQLAESGARRKKRDFQQRLLLLARSFQAGMTLLPGGYLAMPGDIFGCLSLGECYWLLLGKDKDAGYACDYLIAICLFY